MNTPATMTAHGPVPWQPVVQWLIIAALGALALYTLGTALQLPSQRGTGYPLTTQLFQLTWTVEWRGLVPHVVTLPRDAILPFWQSSGGMRFIASAWFLLDALFFVPAYLALLLALRRLCQSVLDTRAPARCLSSVGWGAFTGAGFDQVENALSLVAIHLGRSDPGPWLDTFLTIASHAKWLALLVAAGALLRLGAAWLRGLGWRRFGEETLALMRFIANGARLAFLHTFAVIALVVGVLFVGFVPQVHDILTNLALEAADDALGEQVRSLNLISLTAGVVLWGGSIWYSMRMVATWTPQGLERDNAWHRWARHDLPRLAAYFGVVAVATLCALSMSARASLASALFMGLGAAIMFEALSSLCSGLANRSLLFKDGYRSNGARYRTGALVASLGAALVAWVSVEEGAAPIISSFGWYQPPNMVWRWRAENVDPSALALLALFAGGVVAYVLVTRVRRGPVWHASLNAIALGCWWTAAVFTEAHYSALVFGVVLLVAAFGLWFVAERRHFNWAFFRAIYSLLVDLLPAETRLLARQTWIVQVWFWTILLAGALGTVVIFSVWPLYPGWILGTLGICFMALALWCFVFTFFWIYGPHRLGLGNWAIAPFVLLVAWGQSADRAMRTAPMERQTTPSLPTLHEHHAQWRKDLPDERSPVFLVAAAGGGLRAAYWTGSLLAAMDDRTCGRFGDHLFAVSGVSGGSIGLTAYLAQRKVWAAKTEVQRCRAGRAEELQRFLRRDYLGPVAGSLLLAEVAQALVPFTYLRHERGSTLADAMVHGWRETIGETGADLLERPFLDVMSAGTEGGPRMPAVFLNATTVESGRRAIAANVQLGSMRADPMFFASGASRGVRMQTSDLSVIDAAVNSARFPGISPPGKVMGCYPAQHRVAGTEVVCRDASYGVWGHVVDGGFFENSGLETLIDVWSEVIERMNGRDPAVATMERRRTFVIVISNDKASAAMCQGHTPRYDLLNASDKRRYALNAANAMTHLAEPVNGARDEAVGSDLLAPLYTLASVRSGRSDLALQRAVDTVGCTQLVEWHLSSVMPEKAREAEPPLGWLLSKSSTQIMNRGVRFFADHFPFDLAACPPLTPSGRGLIGIAGQPIPATGCPPLPASPEPLRPGARPGGAQPLVSSPSR